MPTDRLTVWRDILRGLGVIPGIALILIGAAVVLHLSVFVIRRALRAHLNWLIDDKRRRTLQSLFESVVRYVVYFIAFVMILRTLGVDTTAIVASAGALGVAVGLGAQSVMRDIIAGFFLISEGLVHVGDVITVDTHTGTVERVNMRTTQIRTPSGEVWTIPNGRLEVFGNRGPQSGAPR